MDKVELEEGLLSGAINITGPHGKHALERLRILWRRQDSRLAWIATVIAGLTFLATVGWWVWTI
jgi:hypothetical protein